MIELSREEVICLERAIYNTIIVHKRMLEENNDLSNDYKKYWQKMIPTLTEILEKFKEYKIEITTNIKNTKYLTEADVINLIMKLK